MSTRTITLTNRPPVKINEDHWPVIAIARDKEFDGQVERQANRTSRWSLTVRQHSDGRAIVYAVYDYDTNWQGQRSYSAKRGVMLPANSTAIDICEAIKTVAQDIASAESHGDDAARWETLAADCIADMPAEEIA